MEPTSTKEWVKPELKVISFAETNETVLNVSGGWKSWTGQGDENGQG
ncbi:MAG: hypothetical protein HN417_02765 [Desulfobacula sp.]|nr:hypothetical protein [Desulfobacula sp.]